MKIKSNWWGSSLLVAAVLLLLQLSVIENSAIAAEGENSKENEFSFHTKVYLVSPDFWEEAALRPRKPTVRGILESAGITFGPGSSAFYNTSSSQLIIRNRKDQLGLVDSYIDSFIDTSDTQIHVIVRFVESVNSVNQVKFPQKNQTSSRVKLGYLSETSSVDSEREMLKVLGADDIRARIRDLTGPKIVQKEVTGVYTDPQFQVLIRALRKKEGSRFLSEQDWMMRSGQRVIFRQGDQGMGITAVGNADRHTIELKIFSREELGENEENRKVVLRDVTTLQDGQTVVLERKLTNGRYRIEFITARILGSAGNIVRRRVKNDGNISIVESELVDLPSAEAKLKTDQITEVKQADDLALEGARLMADGDFKGGRENFIKSLRVLPSHPITESREKNYLEQLLRAIRKEEK